MSWQTIISIIAALGALTALSGLLYQHLAERPLPQQLPSALIVALLGCICLIIVAQFIPQQQHHQTPNIPQAARSNATERLLARAYRLAVQENHGRGLLSVSDQQRYLHAQLAIPVAIVNNTANSFPVGQLDILRHPANKENITYLYTATNRSLWSLIVIDGGDAEVKEISGSNGTPPAQAPLTLLGPPITQSGS